MRVLNRGCNKEISWAIECPLGLLAFCICSRQNQGLIFVGLHVLFWISSVGPKETTRSGK
jgi:hypothetical protein